MSRPLRILMLEDSALDAELVQRELQESGLQFVAQRVETENELRSALEIFAPDLVLTDSEMPGYSGAAGLALVRERSRYLPVVFVSGTIREDQAVELLKAGATDYVLKQHLSRLPQVVTRALNEIELSRERLLAEARYRDIVENAVVGICRVTPEGRCITANPALARIYGFDSVEDFLKNITNIAAQLYVHPHKRLELLAQLDSEGKIQDHEVEMRRRDGKQIWISTSARVVRDEHGGVVCYEAFVEDITRRKELEAQVLRAQRMESIGTLASGVAHDLNNILSPILMCASVLKRDILPAEKLEIIATIESSAQRGADIVRQVLAFGRGLHGDRLPLHLNHLLKDLVKIVAQTFPKDIRFETMLAEDLWPINADATQMNQILLNLCVNARDAMESGGTLRLRASNLVLDASYASMVPEAKPGRHILIEVSDTGSGIPPEIVERIFDPFFTTKPVGKGTGLGLSTVLGIVRSHEGYIRVESEPDRGTTFQIYLPALAQSTASAPAPAPLPATPRGEGELVLVVDDEPAVRIAAKAVLEAAGYRTMQAADGTEALAAYAQNKDEIRVILTDMTMPYMDGVALIRALARMGSRIPVLASTGHSEKSRIAELKELGVIDILHKPYPAGVLTRALHTALHATPKNPHSDHP
jgi:two-component system, cell cycle sensor histidine kinase and response regulator CckA